MDRDPSVYIVLSLNTHLEVVYSTTHLFDRLGEIAATRVMHEDHPAVPLDELDACMQWGADALNDYYQEGEVRLFS